MNHEDFSPIAAPAKPLLIVLSGLSGVGKDTVLAGLRQAGIPLEISVSATTRSRRAYEKDGVDYYFVSKEKFQDMIDSNQLLEWATVYGNRYGIPKEPVRKALQSGKDVIVKIDVQGAATIKKNLPQAVFIFLTTLTLKELEKRLRKRRTESPAELDLRLKTAGEELGQLAMFDYIIINREGEIDRTIADIKAIYAAEKCRVTPREINI
ncbi:MAG: guanylate kinase [Chloroflexi bacterium RBG_13_52_12]|nr:MAG: guanylate kinase [Chloroflexi bacterium RBG_13_52_12]